MTAASSQKQQLCENKMEEHNEPDSGDQTPQEYQPTFLAHRVSIPKLFQSVEKEGLFTECIECGENLLDTGRQYVIEKVFRGTEPIIELAMCLNCRDRSGECMSAESAQSIQSFFESRVNFSDRIYQLLLQRGPDADQDSVDDWVDRCMFSGELRSEMREYQVVALCEGKEMIRDFFPIMISGQIMEELSSLLSEQTKGWMDDFIDTNFGMPPEFCEPPGVRPVLI